MAVFQPPAESPEPPSAARLRTPEPEAAGPPSTESAPRTRAPVDRKAAKKHAAARSRLLAAGGAGGATLLMMGVMAAAAQPDIAAQEQPAARQVVVVQTSPAATGAVGQSQAVGVFVPAPAEPAQAAPAQAAAQSEGS